MKHSQRLVSVIIVSYNSRNTISRALHSVFIQDYPRIELIVTDDGSDDFSESFINDVIKSADRAFEYVRVLANDENTGTVANLWRALEIMHGDCFIAIGADDSFAGENSISLLVEGFELREWKPLLVTGKTELWSEDMNQMIGKSPSSADIGVLISEDAKELFNTLASKCIIPIVATCFQSEFISKVDAFDRAYQYYEDYPTFLRMARLGIVPAFIDETITLHAAGGIANGTSDDNLMLALYYDRRRMWENEFDPYIDGVPEDVLLKNKERREYEHGLVAPLLNEERRAKSIAIEIKEKYLNFIKSGTFKKTAECLSLITLTIASTVLSCCVFGINHALSFVLLAAVAIELLHLVVFLIMGGLKVLKRMSKRRLKIETHASSSQ